MVLEKISLQNFRGYSKKEFSFSEGTTLILGPNTVGKTNLLEAVYLLASGKSVRAGFEQEMIAYEKEIARVKGRVLGDEKVDLEIILTCGMVGGDKASRKKYLVNGVARRMMDFLGSLRAVYFGPEDLDLVIGSPSQRRKYLDLVLSQADREYARSGLSYEKGLRQRNKLLERIREEGLPAGGQGVPRSQLLFWNQLLIKEGGVLTEKREEFIDFVNQEKSKLPDFKLEYDKSIISPARLEEYAQEEVAAAATLVGPHRDDFEFRIGDRELSAFGSRGEQRLGILWLKMGELEFIAQKTKQRPILLLDDIFSELDHEHRALVLEIIPKQQTIITATDSDLLEKKDLKEVEVLKLS
ncbi:MAG: DNA replication and repair protein RecF [bacterium]|nr:DNA replication and repair protein RecF [bacterium]